MRALHRRWMRRHLTPTFMIEEVVGLDPPHVFDYRIRDARPPVRHEYGRITFTAEGPGTLVEWSSTFNLPAGPLSRWPKPAPPSSHEPRSGSRSRASTGPSPRTRAAG